MCFDLVLLDRVFCDWAEQLGERVWRLIPESAGKRFVMSALGEFALSGIMPTVPVGVRLRASALSERLVA